MGPPARARSQILRGIRLLIAATALRNPALRGIALMVLAVFLFSTMDMLVKLAAERYPINEILFARNFFAFGPVLWVVARSGGVAAIRTRNYWGHVLRSLTGMSAMAFFFASYRALPLGEAVALVSAGTIFMTALSVPLLGEHVGPRRWTAVAVGFLGVLVMTRPGFGVFQSGALLALGGALSYAIAMCAIRRLGRSESNLTIVFHFTLILTLVSGATLPFSFVLPTGADWPLLISIGLIGGCAQFAMTAAFRAAPIGLIAPFDYLALVFATGFGYAVWGDVPDLFLIAGAAIVVASGLYILHREIVLGRARPAEAEPHP